MRRGEDDLAWEPCPHIINELWFTLQPHPANSNSTAKSRTAHSARTMNYIESRRFDFCTRLRQACAGR